MLEARGASTAVLEVARTFQCHACLKYRKPNQVAPASTKVIGRFNQSIQADVMWIKNAQNKFPILSIIVDEGTRFQVAVLINAEKSEDYITALERHWIAPFGIPQRLISDEGRGWLRDSFMHSPFNTWWLLEKLMNNLRRWKDGMQFFARPLKFS